MCENKIGYYKIADSLEDKKVEARRGDVTLRDVKRSEVM